jgi:AraC family L-rhamnose operon transcriptional activator RhaR/AraC family L-rhamnose operon regulatory protein RhaS
MSNSKKYGDSRLPFRVEYRDPQRPFPFHVHEFWQLSFVFSGRGTCSVGKAKYEIQGGDAVIIPPGQIHGFKNIRNIILADIQVKTDFFKANHFGISQMPEFRELFDLEPSKRGIHIKLGLPVFFELRSQIESLIRELSQKLPGYEAATGSLLIQLLLILMRNGGKNQDDGRVKADILNLLIFVRENYRKPLSVKDLTKYSGFSESRVLRIFKQYTGFSPSVYLNRLRITDVAEELISSARSITDIALDAGFNDSNYFSRCFKKYMGVSPREYRNAPVLASLAPKP